MTQATLHEKMAEFVELTEERAKGTGLVGSARHGHLLNYIHYIEETTGQPKEEVVDYHLKYVREQKLRDAILLFKAVIQSSRVTADELAKMLDTVLKSGYTIKELIELHTITSPKKVEDII